MCAQLSALWYMLTNQLIGSNFGAFCLFFIRRRSCNYLLVPLAVSDLCVALLVMPMARVYEVLGTCPFGARVCNSWVAFDVFPQPVHDQRRSLLGRWTAFNESVFVIKK